LGRLAVCGTVNDLAMRGARARYLTLGLIVEEGTPLETLRQVMRSVAAICRETGVALVADGFKFHIPRGYIYFAIAFSAAVEFFNVLARRKRKKAVN